MFRARGTLDLAVRLTKRHLISLKVCVNFAVTHFTISYACIDVFFGVTDFLFSLISLTGLPGVLFVLPDSYVDPENKDYGGE